MALRNGELFLSYGVMGGFMQVCLASAPPSSRIADIHYPPIDSIPLIPSSPKVTFRSC